MIKNVYEYLVLSAAENAGKTAFADKNCSVTYGQLLSDSERIGRALYSRLGGARLPVAVATDHSVSDVRAFFGVIYSGSFYIPLDLSLPEPRVRSILETVRPAAILYSGDPPRIPACGAPAYEINALAAENSPAVSPWKTCRDTDLLYVIFTSGSTGAPKGVSVQHGAVIDMAEQFTDVFAFTKDAVFGNQAPFDFDVSVKDIYISVKNGATVEILEKELFSFPKMLIERMNGRGVNTVIWAVPALTIISRLNALKTCKPERLERIMFSGEIMPVKCLEYWRSRYPDAEFVNLYGPTEITCNCTYHVVSFGEAEREAVPIGVPFPNCDVFLLDGDLPVTREGAPGEICVTGRRLSCGYYNMPEQTEKAFCANPLNGSWYERMYRTGDIGCMKNGLLYYCGRKDSQIKHMGHRIELSEIELCANAAPGVESSACVYWEERSKIALFYTGSAAQSELTAVMKEYLPQYMIPSVITPVRAFPQTRTGKTDRKALLNTLKGEG